MVCGLWFVVCGLWLVMNRNPEGCEALAIRVNRSGRRSSIWVCSLWFVVLSVGCVFRLRVYGFGFVFRFHGDGFRVQGLGFGVQGLEGRGFTCPWDGRTSTNGSRMPVLGLSGQGADFGV